MRQLRAARDQLGRRLTTLAPVDAVRLLVNGQQERYLNGACWRLFEMLHELYPAATAWYDPVQGHVYTRIGGLFYDAKGLHLSPPVRPLTGAREDRRAISQMRRSALKSSQ